MERDGFTMPDGSKKHGLPRAMRVALALEELPEDDDDIRSHGETLYSTPSGGEVDAL